MIDETAATGPETTPTETPQVDTAPVTATPAAEPTMEDTIRETYQKLTTERERGPNGRFLKASGTQDEPAPAPEGEVAEGEVAVEAQSAPKPWESPPNTWSKEEQAEYAGLSERAKQAIHRREADFHKGISQYKDAAAFGNSMFEDVAPHFDVMRQLGATPKEVVRDVMNTWRDLAAGTPDQKRDTLLRLAEGLGINLAEAVETRYRQSNTPPELAPVLQRVAQLEQTISESQRAREEADHASRVGEAQKFLSDPKRAEFIDTVFEDMVALVRAGKSPDDAYEQAIWAHPETRAKLIAREDGKRRQQEAERAAAARKAAATNVQRRGAPPSAPRAAGTMEDTIRETYRQLQGG